MSGLARGDYKTVKIPEDLQILGGPHVMPYWDLASVSAGKPLWRVIRAEDVCYLTELARVYRILHDHSLLTAPKDTSWGRDRAESSSDDWWMTLASREMRSAFRSHWFRDPIEWFITSDGDNGGDFINKLQEFAVVDGSGRPLRVFDPMSSGTFEANWRSYFSSMELFLKEAGFRYVHDVERDDSYSDVYDGDGTGDGLCFWASWANKHQDEVGARVLSSDQIRAMFRDAMFMRTMVVDIGSFGAYTWWPDRVVVKEDHVHASQYYDDNEHRVVQDEQVDSYSYRVAPEGRVSGMRHLSLHYHEKDHVGAWWVDYSYEPERRGALYFGDSYTYTCESEEFDSEGETEHEDEVNEVLAEVRWMSFVVLEVDLYYYDARLDGSATNMDGDERLSTDALHRADYPDELPTLFFVVPVASGGDPNSQLVLRRGVNLMGSGQKQFVRRIRSAASQAMSSAKSYFGGKPFVDSYGHTVDGVLGDVVVEHISSFVAFEMPHRLSLEAYKDWRWPKVDYRALVPSEPKFYDGQE